MLLKPLKEDTSWIGESYQNGFEIFYKDWNWKVYDKKEGFWNRKLKWFFENHDHIKWSEFSKRFIEASIPNLNLAWRDEKELNYDEVVEEGYTMLIFGIMFQNVIPLTSFEKHHFRGPLLVPKMKYLVELMIIFSTRHMSYFDMLQSAKGFRPRA